MFFIFKSDELLSNTLCLVIPCRIFGKKHSISRVILEVTGLFEALLGALPKPPPLRLDFVIDNALLSARN